MSSDDRLTNDDCGRWEVVTETSTYELDLDRMVGRRFPGRGVTSLPLGTFISALHHDGEEWEILDIVLCEIGHVMMLATLDASGRHSTNRLSTMVRAIRAMA